MALGAQPRRVLWRIVRKEIWLRLAGVAVGPAGAPYLTRFLASQLYGVRSRDRLTFAGVTLVLAAVAFAASYIPARRATKADPMVALRYD